MKNKAKELIMQMEVNEYLKEKSREIVVDVKKHFPMIRNVQVVINIWVHPMEEEK